MGSEGGSGAGGNQDTDPWEVTFNKPLEITVIFTSSTGAAAAINYGDLYTNLTGQQPMLDVLKPLILHVKACKIWGTPGGACTLVTQRLINAANADDTVSYIEKIDIGDGVRRPTCHFTWPASDQAYPVQVNSGSSSLQFIKTQFTAGNLTAVLPVIYVKVQVRSGDLVDIPVPTLFSIKSCNGDYKKASKRMLEEECKIDKIKRVKELTMPILNE